MFDLKNLFSLSWLFEKLGVTRDSAVWFVGKLTALILFFAGLAPDQLAQFGIPGSWSKYLMIAAMWIMHVSSQNSTSALVGADAPKS
jgi:hypothetical protein